MTSEEVMAAFDAIIDNLTKNEKIANQAKTIVRDGITENRENSSAGGKFNNLIWSFSAFLIAILYFF